MLNSSQKSKIFISLDAKGNRFLIKCPFYANDLMKAMPNCRWVKKEDAWAAPVIKRNVEYIGDILSHYAEFTPDAADRYKQAVDNMQEVRGTGFPPWFQFKMEPRKHQMDCYNKLYGLSARAIFAEMGTGKSKMAIDMACAARMEGVTNAWLIVCKLSLRRNWVEQIQMHSSIPCDVHLPDTKNEKAFMRWLQTPSDFKVLIVGTESLSVGGMGTIAERFMLSTMKAGMTIDEAHMIAGHKASRSVKCVELGRLAVYREILTGTPIADGPMNLFMQFEFLDPDIIGIGDYYAYRNRYAVMGGYRDPKSGKPMQIVGYQGIDELVQTIAPYTYQITKKEALPWLPDKQYQHRYIQITKEQRDYYKQIKGEKAFNVIGTDKSIVMQTALEVALRLHQVAGGHLATGELNSKGKMVYTSFPVVHWKDNPKISELIDIAEENRHAQGICWCVYKAEINDCKEALTDAGFDVGVISGDFTPEENFATVTKFNEGGYDWIVGNAQTGGVGFTMNAATLVVYYNNTFKLIDRTQSEDRCHRDGQTKEVMYIDLIAEKTIDTTIMKAVEAKKDLAEYIRGRLSDVSNLLDGD